MANHNQRAIDLLTSLATNRIDSQYVTYNDGKWNITSNKPTTGSYCSIDRYAPYLKLQIEVFVNSNQIISH